MKEQFFPADANSPAEHEGTARMFTIRLVQGGFQSDAEMEAVPRIGDSILRPVNGEMVLATVEGVTWELSSNKPGIRVVFVRLGNDHPWTDASSA